MRLIKNIKKQMISKITKFAFLVAFICISFTSKAQCIASFMPFDSVGYGYFWNTSTGTGLTSTWSFGDGTSATGTGDITHL